MLPITVRKASSSKPRLITIKNGKVERDGAEVPLQLQPAAPTSPHRLVQKLAHLSQDTVII